MPHLSSNKISESVEKNIEKRMLLLLSAAGTNSRKKVFSELLTKVEKIMIAKRLTLIYFISKKVPTHTISKMLKMSPSTVARFELSVDEGRYRQTIIWLKQNNVENQFLKLLSDLMAIPFNDNGKPMSLGRFIDEKL